MNREGFRNRMKQYKEAKGFDPLLKYWDWKLKYDSAPQPDNMPEQPTPDKKTKQPKEVENISHRADNPYTIVNRLPLDSPYDDARYNDYRKPRFELRKGDVYYSNPNYLKWIGRFGKVLRGGSILGEAASQLFPSEEAELIEDLRVKMDKQNKLLTGQEDIPKYDEGGKVIPTQEEYITEQIAAEKAAALAKSLSRTMPRVPLGEKRGERWNPHTRKVENIYELGSSCAYTFADNYGLNWMSSEDFRQNHADYGWRLIPWESRQPGDAVLIVDDKGTARHTMMYDSDNAHGQPLFNHSNGGSDESAIRKKAKYPHHNPYLTYEFVGTPADSTQWINDYKKIYGFAEGGEVDENNFMKQFGKQVSYKPEETSWWSDVKNWWNDLTGMKNYAYGNCATTPGGKHTKECAHYSNSILRNQGYKNIVGDAWTRAANSGMKKITSGYDGLAKPIEWNENDAHEYLQSAAENFASKIDTTGLKPYDVIGLYYPDSPNTKKAFEQGRWGETLTHTGHTVIGKDGTHYVVHNVNGYLKINKLADMLTGDYEYKPVSAYRPKKYADGGEVEPDPLEVLEASRPKIAGIPINDKPLSGTDPIGEAMLWGLGGGAASAALRSLFPTYGATAAWLAFGGDNKDNMLVIPNNPTKNTTPIETGLLNKEVRQYYADDVLPRDILTSETDKLKFLNTDKNFEYDLYPQGYFANGVVGHYDRMNDVIRLNSGYVTDKDLLDNVMSHEVNHRYNREFPLDKEHTRILNRAYTVEPKLNTAAARAARKESEKRATNVNIRHKLQTDLRNTLGRKPTKTEMDKFIDSLSDLELLDRLGSASSYGSAYLMSIKERSDLVNQPADQYQKARVTQLRKALKRIAMNENKNDNNQNYA